MNRIALFQLASLLSLFAWVAPAEEEAPEAAVSDEALREMTVRGMASLKPMLGIREGQWHAIESGGEPEIEFGRITTRGATEFDGLGFRIEHLIEVDGKAIEELWIITYIPYPDKETEEVVAGTLVASIFDSLGKHRILEGEWERGGNILKWSNEPSDHPGGNRDEGAPVRELTWKFGDGGKLSSITEFDGEVISRSVSKPAKEKEATFPHLPTKKGIGIMAELDPILGRWENSWSAERKINGKSESSTGKTRITSRRILGGRYVEEREDPLEESPLSQVNLTIIGAADPEAGGDENLRIWFRGSPPPVPAIWDRKSRGIKIDHVSKPYGDLQVISKAEGKFVDDKLRTLESYIHATAEASLLDDEIKISSKIRRIAE